MRRNLLLFFPGALGVALGYLSGPAHPPPADGHELIVRRPVHERSSQTFDTARGRDAFAAQHATPSPELGRARELVDDATARGVWTNADREALREQLATMSGAEQADVVARLAGAIERGAVRVTVDLPL
jgi:hypothetical protein